MLLAYYARIIQEKIRTPQEDSKNGICQNKGDIYFKEAIHIKIKEQHHERYTRCSYWLRWYQ